MLIVISPAKKLDYDTPAKTKKHTMPGFLDDSEESFTLGAGIRQNLLGNINIRFDYSYTDFGRLIDVQKFSLGINF